MNKKVEIHSEKEIQRDLGYPEFVPARITDPKTVYMPVGELYGVKILVKRKIKESGEYLLIE